jgi:hypothetical protein
MLPDAMPKTAYLSEWKKMTATYEGAVTTLAETLDAKPDRFALKVDFTNLLTKIDTARNFRSRLAALENYRKSKFHGELPRSLDVAKAQIALAIAAANQAPPEGSDAPTVLVRAFLQLDKKIRAGERKLIKASQVEQEVANVRLLPPDALGGFRNVDVAALAAFLVTVKLKLPQEVLDDLAVGVEGVSLASMQKAAEDAVEPYRIKALADVAAADSNALDWKSVQASTQAQLERYTLDAAIAAKDEVESYWKQLAKGREALRNMRVEFGTDVVTGSLSIATSVVAIATSWGTFVPAYAKLAKDVAGLAMGIFTTVRGADGVAEDLQEKIETLRESLAEGSAANPDKDGKELLTILGAPFIKSCAAAQKDADTLSGKTTQVYDEAKELLEAVEVGLDKLEAMRGQLGGAAGAAEVEERSKAIDKLCKENDKLLDETRGLLTGHQEHLKVFAKAEKAIAEYRKAREYRFEAAALRYKQAKRAESIKTAANNAVKLVGLLV